MSKASVLSVLPADCTICIMCCCGRTRRVFRRTSSVWYLPGSSWRMVVRWVTTTSRKNRRFTWSFVCVAANACKVTHAGGWRIHPKNLYRVWTWEGPNFSCVMFKKFKILFFIVLICCAIYTLQIWKWILYLDCAFQFSNITSFTEQKMYVKNDFSNVIKFRSCVICALEHEEHEVNNKSLTTFSQKLSVFPALP